MQKKFFYVLLALQIATLLAAVACIVCAALKIAFNAQTDTVTIFTTPEYTWNKTLTYFTLIAGIVLMLFHIVYIVGLVRKWRVFTVVYYVGTVLMFTVFCFLAASTSYVRAKFQQDLLCPDSVMWVFQFDQFVQNASNVFCQTQACECEVFYPQNYTRAVFERYPVRSTDCCVTNVEDCASVWQGAVPRGSDFSNLTQFAQVMEQKFSCQGICVNPRIFLFSNVNDTPAPNGTGTCQAPLTAFFENYCTLFIVLSAVCASLIGVDTLTLLGVVWHVKRSNQGYGSIFEADHDISNDFYDQPSKSDRMRVQ